MNFSQFHPLCNTLCVEVAPWCLLANQLGLTVCLRDENGTIVGEAVDGSVLVPPNVGASSFEIGVSDGAAVAFSGPLHLSDSEWHFRQLMPAVRGFVPREGFTALRVAFEPGHVAMATLASRSEKGIRVMHVKPAFVVSNRTKWDLVCAPVIAPDVANAFDVNKTDFVGMEVDTLEFLQLLYLCLTLCSP